MGLPQLIQNGLGYIEVGQFASTSYIINLSFPAMVEDSLQSPTVIFHIDPIADMHPVSVDGKFLILHRIRDQ
jgi:hypothetical protein